MNGNKRIASPWIKIVKSVGAKALDEKCVETTQNQTMGVIFNTQNSQLVTWSLPTEKSFRYTAKIGLWQIFQFSIFVLSREKCHFQSDWIRNFRFFFPYFGFFPLLLGFVVHSYIWASGVKGEWRVISWLAISNTRKKNMILFHLCCQGFSQRWKSSYNTIVCMINKIY